LCRVKSRTFFWKDAAAAAEEIERDEPQQATDVTPGAGSSQLRVVSYNVLSSSLDEASYFTRCSPEDLRSETRFMRIVEKLEEQMAQGAVICLSPHEGVDSFPAYDQPSDHLMISADLVLT